MWKLELMLQTLYGYMNKYAGGLILLHGVDQRTTSRRAIAPVEIKGLYKTNMRKILAITLLVVAFICSCILEHQRVAIMDATSAEATMSVAK